MRERPQAIVLIGGADGSVDVPPIDLLPSALSPRDPATTIIAADSGLALAEALELHAHVVVGDLDSVDPELLGRAVARGTEVELHPSDKDATDLELALRTAVQTGATHVTVIGGAGGRADHHLANVAVLGAPWLADVEVVAQLGSARCMVVRHAAQLVGEPGSLVSLLPLGAPVAGVTTEGLRWELTDALLHPHSTRGVSNELLDRAALVRIRSGVLLAVQPHSGRPSPDAPRPT